MDEIIAKYLSNEATDSEKEQVENFRKENPEEFLQAKVLFLKSGKDLYNKRSAFENIQARLNDSDKRSRQFISYRSFLKIAASLLLLAGAYFLYETLLMNDSDLAGYSTKESEIIEVTLPDGSIATLHERSSLIPLEVKEERKYKATGKIFFDVVRNEAMPFIVKTDELQVKVLGTSFVVDESSNEKRIKVIVKSGKVKVNTTKNKITQSEVDLEAGDIAIADKLTLITKKIKNTDPNYLSWKTRKMEFNNTPLRKVFQTLEDTYFIDIRTNNEAILDCPLTATFQGQKIDDILLIVSETFEASLKNSDSKYILEGKGCN